MSYSIFDLFKQHAQKFPEKPALIIGEKTLTYKELLKLTEDFAQRLSSLGIGKQTHVATFLGNNLEMVLLLLSAAKLGFVLIPLPPEFPKFFRKKILRTCDVQVAITTSNLKREISEDIPTFAVEEIYGTPPKEIKISENPNLDAPFIITTTSGSTGVPKPIVLTQRVKLLRAFEGAKKVFNLSTNDIYIVSTPLYHSLAQRFTLLPLMTGATAVVMPKFQVAKWLDFVKKYKVTFGVLVSSQLESIANHLWENRERETPSSLRKIISSSAPLLDITRKKVLELAKSIGWEVFETYGTSEIGFATILNLTKETNKWKSVGKPLPYVKIKILKERALGSRDIGEIAVKTKTIFAGYYNMPEKTKQSFDNEGFFLTGDLGYLDSDGYLYFVGRKKEIIITGGINVYPQDVERVLLNHPSVKECAVFGIEAQPFGEIVCALVVPKDKNKFNLSELRKYCRQNLTYYQQPLIWKIVDEIPKNHLGKVSRTELKKLISKEEISNLLEKIKGLL
jgi:long-chain acyl-CoA synthetase